VLRPPTALAPFHKGVRRAYRGISECDSAESRRRLIPRGVLPLDLAKKFLAVRSGENVSTQRIALLLQTERSQNLIGFARVRYA